MVKKGYFLIIFLSVLNSVSAQTIKTKVLIVGGGAVGTGAAIQAAYSGVETILVEETTQLGKNIQVTDTASAIGLEADFIKRYRTSEKLIGGKTDPAVTSSVLKGWTDTVKNLTVIRQKSAEKIEKYGKGWRVILNDGQKIKADVVVDATENGAVAEKAGTEKDGTIFKTLIANNALTPTQLYTNNLYRTSAAVGSFSAPITSFVSTNTENLLVTGQTGSSLLTGQTAGAIAAYCAFFKTTTKNLNIRVIQAELLGYHSALIPLADIHITDSNYVAIQHIIATGILKGENVNGKLYFHADSMVSLEELRQPMKEYYSRSQIWFADRQDEKLTLNDLLSLIKFCGNRGKELNREVEKAWATSFKFKENFDLTKLITRRQTAVLIDAYLKPFNVRVDYTGRLMQ